MSVVAVAAGRCVHSCDALSRKSSARRISSHWTTTPTTLTSWTSRCPRSMVKVKMSVDEDAAGGYKRVRAELDTTGLVLEQSGTAASQQLRRRELKRACQRACRPRRRVIRTVPRARTTHLRRRRRSAADPSPRYRRDAVVGGGPVASAGRQLSSAAATGRCWQPAGCPANTPRTAGEQGRPRTSNGGARGSGGAVGRGPVARPEQRTSRGRSVLSVWPCTATGELTAAAPHPPSAAPFECPTAPAS